MERKKPTSAIAERLDLFEVSDIESLICRTKQWELRRAGKLPYHRIGSKILYRGSDLEALLAKTRRNGTEG